MRSFVISSLLLAAVPLGNADTIRLKNGRTIAADSVQESGGRVEYSIGEDTYSIPKTMVLGIDTGGAPVARSKPADAPLAVEEPADPTSNWVDMRSRIVRDGRVDPDALVAIENEGNAEASAAAHFAAGRLAHDAADLERARQHLQKALSYLPDKDTLLVHYAYLLVRMARYSEAISFAERATRLSPASPEAFRYLGFALYGADRTRDAVRAWKRSLELRADRELERILAKAERELNAEADFGQQEGRYFTLRYEGQQSPQSLRREIMRTLDGHYEDLVRQLGIAPRESIAVVLYTREAYFDVTQAPRWSGALYDGKLRIPVGGVASVTPDLSRALKHELTHSFTHQITRGRCPTWLNEGVAMLLEPRGSRPFGRQLASLYGAQKQVPLSLLESSFFDLSREQATVAYAQSLATVEYIRDTYGMSDVVRILQRIGEGAAPEAALRSTIRAGYAALEDEMAQSLRRVYGE